MLMLRLLVMLASIANCAGGLVLMGTWATMWQHVPPIVLFIGVSLLIQGAYTILYLRGDLDRWEISPRVRCSPAKDCQRASAPVD